MDDLGDESDDGTEDQETRDDQAIPSLEMHIC